MSDGLIEDFSKMDLKDKGINKIPWELHLRIADYLGPEELNTWLQIYPQLITLLRPQHFTVQDRHHNTLIHKLTETGEIFLPWLLKIASSRPAADYNAVNGVGNTPLMHAVERGTIKAVRTLVKLPAVNVNAHTSRFVSALSIAAFYGREDVTRALLRHEKIDINMKEHGWMTPLMLACRQSHSSVARLLITRRELQPNVRDIAGRTALNHACRTGLTRVVQLLLARQDVDKTCRDVSQNTPLLTSVIYKNEDVVELLLTRGGLDIEAKDRDGQTPLTWAVNRRSSYMVSLLLKHGAQPSIQLLNSAIMLRYTDIARLFVIRDDIDVNESANGATPLCLAITYRQREVIRLLFRRTELAVNTMDRHGLTPLHYAIKYGDEALLAQLLNRGAQPHVSINGKTLLEFACEMQRPRMATIIRQALDYTA